MRGRRVTLAASIAAVAALALAGCGSSNTPSAPQTSLTNPIAQPSSPSPAPANTPQAVVSQLIGALRTGNPAAVCGLVAPAQDQQCNSTTVQTALANATMSNVVIHRTVTSGDHALVSVTGKICVAGHCQGSTNANYGMPSSKLTFDGAWKLAFTYTATPTAGWPCVKVGGKWYPLLA